MRIVIADVLYTMTDETYYVLDRVSSYNDIYRAESLEQAFMLLKADGWTRCGKVRRSDSVLVDMFQRNNENIAIWQEAEAEEEESI